MDLIKGIDISKHNPTIDWDKIKADGYEFVYLKISQGVGYVDPAFKTHYESAKRVGLKIGLYHFASLNKIDEEKDAKEEADFFNSIAKGIKTDLLPVLDVETNEIALEKDEVERWMRTYVNNLDEKCVLYSSAGFLNSYLQPNHSLSDLPLWLSGYPLDRNTSIVTQSLSTTLRLPKPPIGWADWIIWQWTGKGTVDGVTGWIDLNLAKKLPIK